MIITGPPAAGKTTAAAAIAAGSARPAVHLHTDDFYGYIKAGFIPPWQPGSQRQNEVVIGVIADAAIGFARGGYLVVVDGIVGPWFLRPFRERAGEAGIALHYAVLRPRLAENLRRARERPAGQLRLSGPIRDLHGQFSGLGPLEAHVLDTTGLTAEQVTGELLAALRSGRARLA